MIFSALILTTATSNCQNTFPASGNVGIGTTTPQGGLDVSGLNINAWSYFRANANGINPSASINFGLITAWNPSAGSGETQILYGTGAGSGPRLDFGRWSGSVKNIDLSLVGGNVGIGTTTPLSNLTVNQTSASKNGLWITGAEYYNPSLGTDNNNGISLTLGVNRPGNRQVWIGSSQVVGSSSLGLIRFSTGSTIPTLDGVTGDGNARLHLGLATATTNVIIGNNESTLIPSNKLTVYGNSSIGSGYYNVSAPANGMIVQGYLGIGTPSPAYPLHVNGNVLFGTQPASGIYTAAPLNMSNNQGGAIKTQLNLINGGGGGGAESAIDFYTYTDNGNGLPGSRFGSIDDGNYSGHLVFFTKGQGGGGTGSLTEKMRITSTGSVGIGTTTPGSYMLAVNGSAIFTKVQVKATSNPWPDYVFHPIYELRSLSSLESYINEFNHLPDMPSAREVEKDGLDIASTQAALLKKIEELTLYLINLNKTIVAQQKEIEKLKLR